MSAPVYVADIVVNDINYEIIGYYYDKDTAITDAINFEINKFEEIIGKYKDEKNIDKIIKLFNKYKDNVTDGASMDTWKRARVNFLKTIENKYYEDSIMDLHTDLANNVCDVSQIKIK
jgi:hypothetical protein